MLRSIDQRDRQHGGGKDKRGAEREITLPQDWTLQGKIDLLRRRFAVGGAVALGSAAHFAEDVAQPRHDSVSLSEERGSAPILNPQAARFRQRAPA
jgi:hypothetical protein